MKSLYIVTAIADGIIKVSPASVLKMTENGTTEQSMTGNDLTAKNVPQSIQVTNPLSFPIECGSAVYIGFSKTAESFRGIPARPDFDCRRRVILRSCCRSTVYARRKSAF